MKFKTAIIFISFFLLSSCNSESGKKAESSSADFSKVKQMEWLIGQWSMVEKEKILYESWSKINDTIIAGASVMTMHGDTIYTEKLSIRLISGELFYVPMVSNQNNGKPIMFHLVSNEEGVFVFENKLHDFPQRIVYAHPKEDSLYAYIEGMDKGKMDKIEFPMVRVK